MEQDIKRNWGEAKFSSFDPRDMKFQSLTALQALIERYRRFSRFSLLFAFFFPFWLWRLFQQSGVESNWALYGFLAYIIVYFAAAFLMDNWLAKGLNKIDIVEMPVAEVCRKAFFYRKKHLQFMAILIPMAVLLLVWMGLLLSSEIYFVEGMITGAIVGAGIGFVVFRKFMREYRFLTTLS